MHYSNFILSLIFVITFGACSHQSVKEHQYTREGLALAEGLSYEIVYQAGDLIKTKDQGEVPAAKDLDLIVLMKDAQQQYLYIGHESSDSNHRLGDGGHMTKVTMDLEGTVLEKEATDFTKVHGTAVNCGGSIGPDGMIYSAEEFPAGSNKVLYNEGIGIRDTTPISGYDRYLDYGWMVQIDPKKNEAVQKMFAMGRYSHEDLQFMPDGKTVYLSDDFMPACIFKFVADVQHQYDQGQLYALSLQEGSYEFDWIPLPNNRDSLNDIRNVAIRKGASLFARHEWMTLNDEVLYIGETGYHNMAYEKAIKAGGKIAYYFESKRKDEYNFSDPHGRILKLNPKTHKLEVMLEGGVHGDLELSNPDCIEYIKIKDKDYLFICEDRQGKNKAKDNQIFRYDIQNHKLDLILTAPKGAECTGLCFDATEKLLYVNIQHPSSLNAAPFNKGTTIRIKGLFD